MGVFLTPADLAPFATIDEAKANEMITDAEAMAALAAPCITNQEFMARAELVAGVKAILRGAILRWDEAGAGALTQRSRTGGPFSESESIDTRTKRKAMFWPSEIEQLRDICGQFNNTGQNRAFSFRPCGGRSSHLPWCNFAWGAEYCSCGTDIAGYAIYETGEA